MTPPTQHDVAPLTVPSVETGEGGPPDQMPRLEADRPAGMAADQSGAGQPQPTRGMHAGETKIGPLNDPND